MAIFSQKQHEQARPKADTIAPRTQWEHQKPAQEDDEERPRTPVDAQKIRRAVRYAFFGILGIAAVSGFALYVATVFQQKPDPLAIAVDAPGQVQPGARIQFSVLISNQDASQDVRDATITVKADDGTLFPDAQGFAAMQRSLALVQARTRSSESFNAIFWGKAGDQRVLDVAVRYRFGDGATVFEKTQRVSVTIASSPVALNLQLPDQVLPGQNFLFSLQYKNAGGQAIQNARVAFEVPSGMRILQSDPQLANATGTPLLSIASFPAGQQNVISIKSVVDKNEGQGKKIVARAFMQIRNTQIEIGRADADLLVIASPLALSIAVQGKDEYRATIGETLTYEFRVTNNYPYALKDVVVNVDVSDPWFVLPTVQVRNGSFSSRTKLVTWNGGSNRNLLVIDPGKTEVVSFSVDLKNSFWQKTIQNTVGVKATVSASNRPQGVGTQIATTAQATTRINGTLSLAAPVYFRDPQNAFTNIGTVPPRANQLNQYTVYVTVGAQGNDFRDLQVSTVLPGNVTFEGKVKGDTAGFVYNPRTNEIAWDISSLSAYATKQIIFQINFIPSVAQVGRAALILDKVAFTGTDSFTGDTLTQQQEARFSNLSDDPSVSEETGKIAP